MSQLIDRDEVIKILKDINPVEQNNPDDYHYNEGKREFAKESLEAILSLPLQQGGNEKIKELIEKKIVDGFRNGTITKSQNEILRELLSEI